MKTSPSLALYRFLSERRGHDTEWRPERRQNSDDQAAFSLPWLWFHCPSPLDLDSIFEIVVRLSEELPDLQVVTTTEFDPNQVDTAELQVPMHVVMVPPENLGNITEFLNLYKPVVGAWIGHVPRPFLVSEAHKSGVELVMIDAPKRSEQQRWSFIPGVNNAVFKSFACILAGDAALAEQAKSFISSDTHVELNGYIEHGKVAPTCDETERHKMSDILANRPVWFALSAALDELPMIVAAHNYCLRRAHRLLLIIAPANNAQAEDIAAYLVNAGIKTGRRSLGHDPNEELQAFIADVEDEVGLWLRLAPTTFLGSTLVAGQTQASPFAPAALGSAVIHGPFLGPYAEVCEKLDHVGGALSVSNGSELGSAVEALLAADKSANMAHAAWELGSTGAEALDRAVDVLLDRFSIAVELRGKD